MGLLVFVFLSQGHKERLCLDGCRIAVRSHTLARQGIKQCLITPRAPAGTGQWGGLCFPLTAGPKTEGDTFSKCDFTRLEHQDATPKTLSPNISDCRICLRHPPARPRRPAVPVHWSYGGSSRRPAASNPSQRRGGWTRPPTPQRSRRRTAPRSASLSPSRLALGFVTRFLKQTQKCGFPSSELQAAHVTRRSVTTLPPPFCYKTLQSVDWGSGWMWSAVPWEYRLEHMTPWTPAWGLQATQPPLPPRPGGYFGGLIEGGCSSPPWVSTAVEGHEGVCVGGGKK